MTPPLSHTLKRAKSKSNLWCPGLGGDVNVAKSILRHEKAKSQPSNAVAILKEVDGFTLTLLYTKPKPSAAGSVLEGGANGAKRIFPGIAKGVAGECSGAQFAPTWRSGWDSNPRAVACKLISSQPRYDHFDTAAQCITLYLCGGEKSSVVCVFGPPGWPAAISDVCGCARAVNGAAPALGPRRLYPEFTRFFTGFFAFGCSIL